MDAADVADLVRRLPGWERAEPTVTPIPAGITNRNYRVELDGRSWVVRIPGERTELLGIDRAGEAEAASRAAALGIGPPVLGPLPGVGTLVTAFVAGETAEPAGLTAPGVLEDVATAIRRFHGSGPIGSRFPIFRVVEWHARDAATNGVPLPDGWERLRELAAAIEAVFPAAELEATPCHNDLLPANVLLAPDRIWVIDFEYAGMNHPAFDLANLAVNAGLDDAADERLLACYEQPVTERRRDEHTVMKVMSELREGAWALVQQAISTLGHVDFEAYADERLAHAAELGAGPAVRKALARLGAPR